jgi:hypothetical protein
MGGVFFFIPRSQEYYLLQEYYTSGIRQESYTSGIRQE